ncbi:PP2C family protein-serine/threonine phosphatase [Mesoplasma seiffertii]|uniref:PP2C family protein-serine/threonine phosphatase n=1 Tax=Mesoplasma seiffertii TaxID=28224 RepID=UPI0004794D6B|nr:protein phosphatase 2C domain-containing protein [Mesoplasma seiffertii]
MKYKAFKMTDKGNFRKTNQDYSSFVKNKAGDFFAIVCDGMGGHAHGEIASKLAVDKFVEIFNNASFKNQNKEWINRWMRLAVEDILISMKIYAELNPQAKDMGTTLTAILFTGDKGYVINIGDSRTHKFQNNKIYNITKDQNLWNATTEEERREIDLHKRYGDRFNEVTYWKVLTSALGPTKSLKIDTYIINEPEGLYFLTSDGVHDYIDDETAIEILNADIKPKKKCAELIDLAKSNFSTDNLTILMLEVEQNEPK